MPDPLINLDDLNESWRLWTIERNPQGKLTQGGTWRKDNPGEWQKLAAYHNGSGPRPDLASITGKQMVEMVDALIEARGSVTPQPPPSEFGVREGPRGPFTEKVGSIFLRDSDGAKTEKMYITSSKDYGIANMTWPYDGDSTGLWEVRDCKAEKVSAVPPRSMDGTGEAGLWIGEKALVERGEFWGAWMGGWSGAACKGSRVYDTWFKSGLIPFYFEHYTTDVEFHYCTFGPKYGTNADINEGSSCNFEWWYKDGYGDGLPYGGRSGTHSVKFFNCDIWCPPAPADAGWRAYQYQGAFLDAGTFDILFRNCRTWGPGGAYGFPNKMIDPTKPNRVENNKYENKGTQITFHDNLIG